MLGYSPVKLLIEIFKIKKILIIKKKNPSQFSGSFGRNFTSGQQKRAYKGIFWEKYKSRHILRKKILKLLEVAKNIAGFLKNSNLLSDI
jgi:hypothetical protein